jgi:hypothetical protein
MKNYIPIVVIAVLTIALMHQCGRADAISNRANANNAAFTDTISYYKNSLGTTTASVKTLKLEKNQLASAILDKDAKLQKLVQDFVKLKSVAAFKSTVQFDTINAAFDNPILSDANDTLTRFERSGIAAGAWFRLGYRVNNDSLIISPFTTWTETTVITGFKKTWLLGKQTAVTDIINTNPHIDITSIRAAQVVVPEPWYKKWYVWLAAGVAGGLLVR